MSESLSTSSVSLRPLGRCAGWTGRSAQALPFHRIIGIRRGDAVASRASRLRPGRDGGPVAVATRIPTGTVPTARRDRSRTLPEVLTEHRQAFRDGRLRLVVPLEFERDPAPI